MKMKKMRWSAMIKDDRRWSMMIGDDRWWSVMGGGYWWLVGGRVGGWWGCQCWDDEAPPQASSKPNAKDGNVACMVNGAGLAMSTMDAWKCSPVLPASSLLQIVVLCCSFLLAGLDVSGDTGQVTWWSTWFIGFYWSHNHSDHSFHSSRSGFPWKTSLIFGPSSQGPSEHPGWKPSKLLGRGYLAWNLAFCSMWNTISIRLPDLARILMVIRSSWFSDIIRVIMMSMVTIKYHVCCWMKKNIVYLLNFFCFQSFSVWKRVRLRWCIHSGDHDHGLQDTWRFKECFEWKSFGGPC